VIERLAIWYLKRRGMCVLPPGFIGFAVGYAQVFKRGGDQHCDHWSMITPKNCKIIALTHSTVITKEPTK
jgi:hypothetical protein